jgi:hypothetical protein
VLLRIDPTFPCATSRCRTWECHLVDVADMLRMEIEENDQVRVVIDQLNGEILALHNIIEILKVTITNLETQLAEKDAQIPAFQAQLQPPPPPANDDGEEDADDDDDGDEGSANAVEEEEEDPKAIYVISDDDEDMPPAKNTEARSARG